MTSFRYFLEALILYIIFYSFKIMPVDWASGIGGFLGRSIGPRLAASRKAYKNLNIALPDLSESEQKTIIMNMWDNLGRIIAEHPHLEYLSRERTEIVGKEFAAQALAKNKGGVFASGHVGNWEIFIPAMLTQCDQAVHVTYRAPNNPWSDRLLTRARSLGGRIHSFPKTRSSGRGIMQTIKDGGYLGILIDQKYNEGVSVPFFGISAMTNPVFASLPQKYKCPLVPFRVQRQTGANFTLSFYEPLLLFTKDGEALPSESVIKNAHELLESWIKEKPEQWLWLHRRWPAEEMNKDE